MSGYIELEQCAVKMDIAPRWLAAASERDSFEEKTLKEEKHNDDGKHDQT
jgi:hypothetical protein